METAINLILNRDFDFMCHFDGVASQSVQVIDIGFKINSWSVKCIFQNQALPLKAKYGSLLWFDKNMPYCSP